MTTPVPSCPDCEAPLDLGRSTRCPQCRLPLVGADAAALWQLTLALRGLEVHRLTLVQQRERLLAGLRARRDDPDIELERAWTAPAPSGVDTRGWTVPPRRGSGREVSGPSAQTVLLVLGGLLVTVAALAFTVVNWGRLGIGGRTVVLAALTGCALSLPYPLRRRGLNATAETSAAIGLALVMMDAYAGRAADLAGLGAVNGLGYWAVATLVISIGAGAYGWATGLRLPLAAGFVIGRLPALLAVNAVGLHGADAGASAMVATAAVDCALLVNRPLRTASLHRAAVAGAALWGVTGGAVAAVASLTAALSSTVPTAATSDALATTAWAWLPLGGLALLALLVALRHPELGLGAGRSAGCVAGVAVLVAAGGSLAVTFPQSWAALAYAVPAALLVTVSAALLRRDRGAAPAPHLPALTGAFYAAGGALLAASMPLIPDLARSVAEPLRHARAAWAGGPGPGWDWTVAPAALTGLWLLAGVVAVVAVLRVTTVPAAPLQAALALMAVPALGLLPVACGLPYGAAVGILALLTLAAALVAVLRAAGPAVLVGLTAAPALALLWALADRAATITVLGALVVLAGALTVRRVGGVPSAATACCAVLALGAEAVAIGDSAGLAFTDSLVVVLVVAIGTAPVATRTAGSVSLSIEATGYGLAGTALALTVGHPGWLAFDLTVAGVAALVVALRADRRRAAGLTATALLIAASWIRLVLSQVHTPEAYTLPLACVALTLGLLHRRRRPTSGSWSAYGAGLGLGLLPTLLALWSDGHWLRPLLLGSAALAVTLIGARRRLQCPLLLGGGTLLLVGAHELAPTVVQVLGLLPRWVPLALAGLLLLALGATYEQRLRDARRLRESLQRLR
ncbi:hypothetical protein P3T36_004195 [Kitasatospora sp. MAP12-15]|uniref:SCO7613 C-terminal domain-containing membrane protein n=1 Tax=unclassified Kitasatospora TaxID=2633591 RepID=UPI002474B76D|nr:hypothetical protein [Kitasatospora sp. MAP12-44]MDH6108340.1 hypothetical protein [Kitasatospora sp. MAP12-44]